MGVETRRVFWADAAATSAWGHEFGQHLARSWTPGQRLRVGLEGALGAGKSHLSRAILQGLGVRGSIPSPTYSLLETYAQAQVPAAHMDWYRLHDPLELDMLDWEGLVEDYPVMLVEWPGRLADYAADFDLLLKLRVEGAGRSAELQTRSPFAKGLVQHFQAV